MKKTFEQVLKLLDRANFDVCSKIEKKNVQNWISRFVEKSHLYGNQNGKSKLPLDALQRTKEY